MTALTPGRRLGPYEIIAPIGAGGMGTSGCSKDSRRWSARGGRGWDSA